MPDDILIIVKTAAHRYAVRREDMADLKMTNAGDLLYSSSRPDRPYLNAELGPLLDPADTSELKRRCAMIVPLRRRSVALLVDQVEAFLEQAASAPLPALIQKQLRQPWAVGAIILDQELVVQLDLRAVAQSALLSQPTER